MDYKISKEELNPNNPDWKIHAVSDADTFKKNMCDCHTHGLRKYGSKELQLVLNVNLKTASYILNSVGGMIRSGTKFQAGDRLFGLFENQSMAIGFIDEKDDMGADILRVCIPDENGNSFPEEATGVYALQDSDPYIHLLS